MPCLKGWAFSAPTGLVPFGEVTRFQLPGPSQDENREGLVFDSVFASTAEVKTSHLCFGLESRSTYEDPLNAFFFDRKNVQHGVTED